MKHPVIHLPLSSQAEFRGQTAGLKRGKAVKVRAPPNFIHRPAANISLPPATEPARVSLRPSSRTSADPIAPSIHRPPPSTPSPRLRSRSPSTVSAASVRPRHRALRVGFPSRSQLPRGAFFSEIGFFLPHHRNCRPGADQSNPLDDPQAATSSAAGTDASPPTSRSSPSTTPAVSSRRPTSSSTTPSSAPSTRMSRLSTTTTSPSTASPSRSCPPAIPSSSPGRSSACSS